MLIFGVRMYESLDSEVRDEVPDASDESEERDEMDEMDALLR